MYDRDIRQALLAETRSEYASDSDTIIVEEMGLNYGEARVDVAVVNGVLHGFEIKSDRDSLRRLARQACGYNSVLDLVTLICSEKHRVQIIDQIPSWWGVRLAERDRAGKVRIVDQRQPKRNSTIDPVCVASLLWSNEALACLDRIGAARGIRSKPRRRLYHRLAEVLSLDDLRAEVRAALKLRNGWRADGRQR